MARLKKLSTAIAVALCLSIFASAPLFAQPEVGIIPRGEESCDKYGERGTEQYKIVQSKEEFQNALAGKQNTREELSKILGCAVKTGRIRLFMLPFFITYLVQFLLGLAGLIAVLFLVLGGYRYVLGGLTEDKESGKKTIQHALIGLVVALSAWIVVNFIQVALTS